MYTILGIPWEVVVTLAVRKLCKDLSVKDVEKWFVEKPVIATLR
jgi:hypothetical protein